MANNTLIKEIPVHVGDTVRVYYKIIEHETKAGKTKKEVEEKVRERLQPYEGIVIGIKGVAENRSFTVRRIGINNVGIERIFPVISPWIKKISVIKHGLVRRAKLNYLRKSVKQEKIKEEKIIQEKHPEVNKSAKPQKQPTTS